MTPLVFVAGGATALFAAWRERRRTRRADPDAVGWLDWRGVQLAGLGMVAVAGLIALRN